jgi:predicted Fe-Mo cluster-binding NifX family protein
LATASAQVMENSHVSGGESPAGRSILQFAMAESTSAVMCASMGLNWLQIKT